MWQYRKDVVYSGERIVAHGPLVTKNGPMYRIRCITINRHTTLVVIVLLFVPFVAARCSDQGPRSSQEQTLHP